jgi:enamine deaminase RidA (YjgF/YER057c/UK114 family)
MAVVSATMEPTCIADGSTGTGEIRRQPGRRAAAVGQDERMSVDDRIRDLGLSLPEAPRMPAGVVTTFSWVRIIGDRVLVSGHGPQSPDGSPAGPFGRVPDEVSAEQAMASARLAALAVISSIRGVLGDLDLIDAWVTVTGFVQAQPGYAATTAIINSFSQVVIDVFGTRVGQHARTAIGVAALPQNLPVVVSAELHLARPPSPE